MNMKTSNGLITLGKTRLVFISLTALFLFAPWLSAEEAEEATNPAPEAGVVESIQLNIEDRESRELSEAADSLVEEAVSAVLETRNAVAAIEAGDRKEAVKALEKVTGKLELLLARRPELGLMPISASTATFDIVADIQAVRGARAEAEYLLEKGYLQAARRLLDTLVSEIRITTVNLPLNTYPLAIKSAVRMVDEEKLDEARSALVAALSTLVVTEQSIPIPILNAQFLLDSAAGMIRPEEGEAREVELTDEDRDRVLALLERAREELELAEELGYGRRDREFTSLCRQIERIEEEINEEREAGGLLDDLIENLQQFKEKIVG